jgi:hypothetical protein
LIEVRNDRTILSTNPKATAENAFLPGFPLQPLEKARFAQIKVCENLHFQRNYHGFSMKLIAEYLAATVFFGANQGNANL